ncbi:MAG: hypothetical protein LBE59_04415, partial [Nevskiaceae bacterium]|nr:hypothetical protein [Nevskiaceae bacterium]
MNLPWLAAAQQQLAHAAATGRLPHALLIHDSSGAGGVELARNFAQRVLCEATPDVCGRCASCRQAQAGEHPDLRLVVPDPEMKSGQITVDQVRELSAW